MKHLDADILATVSGGANTNTEISQSLTSIKDSLSSLSNTKGNDQSNLLLPLMMLTMNRRRATSVVSANGATIVQG